MLTPMPAGLPGSLKLSPHLSPRVLLQLQRTLGNRSVTRLLAGPGQMPTIQRVRSISDVTRTEPRITPQQALVMYLDYLYSLAAGLAPYLLMPIGELRSRIEGVSSLNLQQVTDFRKEIKIYVDQLQELESQAIPEVVDSDVAREYQPLKACVIQSLEQHGSLKMKAAAYHDKLWKEDNPFKYYDMDETIGPLYTSFGLTETPYGGKYKDLVKELPIGKYIVNVDSPAGPNGHMFSLEIKANSTKNKPNVPIARQDPDNMQSWQDGDKILRYWH